MLVHRVKLGKSGFLLKNGKIDVRDLEHGAE